MNKNLLVKLGVPSFFAALVCVVWLVGTTPISDGLPIAQFWHKHFVKMLNKPSPMDLANNDKINIQKYYLSVKYQLDKHKVLLKEMEKKHPEPTVKFQIKMELWKTERDQLQKQIDHWEKRTQQNQSSIDMLIAGTS